MKRMRGMITGMMLGATAVSLYSMMNSRTQRKIGRYAANAGKRVASFTSDLFGR